ncbi:MAG: ATP-dependent 6-phosphofructokinase [Armatimonadetes bacterium]|nr:ATP-dependent 6-phosphofructokinase [Armatimonadota bacterium]
MARSSGPRCVGILTAGGDCPGLNAAIRGVAKAAISGYGMKVVGVCDGFRGLVENRMIELHHDSVSNILTAGGTILGTSRDKLHKMPMGGRVMDMTDVAAENAERHQIDCLLCLGGGGTANAAFKLSKRTGLPVMTLPKTIDNDIAETDTSFGYDTALGIATEAIDRLHTTATSHHRMIVVETMGHTAGWLALGAGVAGGADVILIPELPYRLDVISEYLLERRRHGKRFSIVVVAEGVHAVEEPAADDDAVGEETPEPADAKAIHVVAEPTAHRITRQLQQMTGTEARVTSLGHVQRGGSPSAADRVLCTRLGTTAAQLLADGVHNVMVAIKGTETVPVELEKVAGIRKTVPADHPLVESARLVGTCLGDAPAP